MDTTIEQLAHICFRVNTMCWLGQFNQVNQVLLDMPITESTEILVGTLRFASAAREQLPDYAKVVNTVDAELERRGLDPKRILRGLYEGESTSSN